MNTGGAFIGGMSAGLMISLAVRFAFAEHYVLALVCASIAAAIWGFVR